MSILNFVSNSRGKDFRLDYGNLSVLCAIFSNVPVVAMTATASRNDRKEIKEILAIRSCCEVVGNPNRKNIMYSKHLRFFD